MTRGWRQNFLVHLLDRGDVIDMLEEAITSKGVLAVELRSARHFTDHVRDLVTHDDEDWAVFESHEPVAVTDIRSCSRAEPIEPTYAGKLG